VNGRDLRLAGIYAELGENWNQCCPEGLERLRGFPDVEQLDLAASFECDVIKPASWCSGAYRFEPIGDLVVLFCRELVGCEVHAKCHARGPFSASRLRTRICLNPAHLPGRYASKPHLGSLLI
jgi:hypothetical protein